MARTAEDLDGYLTKLERRYEKLDDGTYLIAIAPRQPPLAMRVVPPLVVLQVDIGRVSEQDPARCSALYKRLLELNAQDLMHAAYGLTGDRVTLTSALELDNLDLNELEAVLADVSLALSEHVPALKQLVGQQS
jgi:hypothetical protein